MYMQLTFQCKHYERWTFVALPTPKRSGESLGDDIIDLDWLQGLILSGEPSEGSIQMTMLEELRRRYPDISPPVENQGGFGRVYHRVMEWGGHRSADGPVPLEYRAVVFQEPHLQTEGWVVHEPLAVQAFRDHVKTHRTGYASCWIRGDELIREWGPGWVVTKITNKDWLDYLPIISRVVFDTQTYENKLLGQEKVKRTKIKKRLKAAIQEAADQLTVDELGEVILEIFGGRLE